MRYLLFLILVASLGCGQEVVFEKSIDTNEPWTYNQALTYDMDIEDTEASYNLEFTLSHSPEFTYQNLYVLIQTTYPGGEQVEDQVSLQICNKMGEFFGNCSGSRCTVKIMLQEKFKFQQKGRHTITIAQHSRLPDLQGVQQGKLRLVKSK